MAEGFDYITTMTRAILEELCLPLFKKCLTPIDRVLRDSAITLEAVHEVILVGGSTRIPKIIQFIQEFFDGKQLNRNLNPEEAVVYGAAIQAAALSGQGNSAIQNLLCLDANPITLGIETSVGLMTTLIHRGTTIPLKKTQTFTTNQDNQESIKFKIFEGERFLTKDCNTLGTFTITGLPRGPKGLIMVEVIFELNEDNILEVTAHCKSDLIKYNVTCSKGNLNNDEISLLKERGMKLSQKYIDAERETKENIELENLIFLARNSSSNQYSEINEIELVEFKDVVNKTIGWIRLNPKESLEEYWKRQKKLEKLYRLIFTISKESLMNHNLPHKIE